MRNFLLLLIALLVGTGCSHHDASQSSGVTSYTALRSSVLTSNCERCHSGANPARGIDVSSYKALMASGAVVAGNSTASRLYASVANGSMPPGSPLSPDLVSAIQDWIDAGAKDDSGLLITSISPNNAGAGIQTIVTVRGQGFKDGVTLSFGGSMATNVTVISSTELTCLAPARSPGSVDVEIFAAPPDRGSFISRGSFYYGNGAGGLSVSSVVPSSGIPGTLMQINGYGFEAGMTVTVDGATCANVTVASTNMMSCNVPDRATSGPADIVLTNRSGTASVTYLSGFFYTVAASYTQIQTSILNAKCTSCHGNSSPAAGKALTSYNAVMGDAIVLPRLPGDSPLYLKISGTTPHQGVSLSSAELLLIWNWITNGCWNDRRPQVTAISQPKGSANGGTTLTISGTGFLKDAAVSIGGSSCLGGTTNSNGTQITNCQTTPHASGVASVVVINPPSGGVPTNPSDPAADNINFTYVDPPAFASANAVTPTHVKSSNTSNLSGSSTITITGTGFVASPGGSTVKIGNLLCLNVSSTTTSITCTPPPQPVPGNLLDIVVTNPDNQLATLSAVFNYDPGDNPVVSSVSPTYAYTGVNTTYTITGDGFFKDTVNNTKPTVSFGATAGNTVTVTNGQTVSAKFTTNTAASSIAIKVVNYDNGTSNTNVGIRIFQSLSLNGAAATPAGIFPNTYSAASPPTSVVISGKGFQQTAESGATVSADSVTIGGNNCPITSVNATTIICTPPACTDAACTGGTYSVTKDVVVHIPALGNVGDTFTAQRTATGTNFFTYTQ